RTPKTHSRQNAIDQLAVNIRQAKIAALEAVGEFLVIDPKAVHHRSIEVMDVHRILGHVIAIVVGGPVTESAFHAAARHPNRIATAMMIATVIVLLDFALRVNRAAKFTAPNYQGIVQHAAALQILHQRGAWLIRILALLADAFGQRVMLVPSAMI